MGRFDALVFAVCMIKFNALGFDFFLVPSQVYVANFRLRKVTTDILIIINIPIK